MLFVFSWPAATLSSGTLWCGIEYQCESFGDSPLPYRNHHPKRTEDIHKEKNSFDATQYPRCLKAEMRPKRIEFDYLPSNSKEAMDNDFDFFDS